MNWDTTSKKYLDPKQIKRIDPLSSEKIKGKFLFDFIKTQLELSSYESTNQQIFYSYNSYKKLYEIYFYQSSKRYFTPIDYAYSYAYKYKLDFGKSTLFIKDDFFIFFVDGVFALLRENNNYSKEDIEKYIFSLYSVKIDSIIFLEDEILELSFYTKYLEKSKKQLVVYIVYVLILLCGSLYYFWTAIVTQEQSVKSIVKEKIQYSTKINKNLNHLIRVNKLFKIIKKYKLTIIEYKYKKKLFLSLQGSNENINIFLKQIGLKTNIISINKENKMVVLEIVI